MAKWFIRVDQNVCNKYNCIIYNNYMLNINQIFTKFFNVQLNINLNKLGKFKIEGFEKLVLKTKN